MLPLLAGIAVGAGAVVAVNNNKKLKEKISSGAKTVAQKAKDVKETVGKKVDCLTSKEEKETKKTEEKDATDTK